MIVTGCQKSTVTSSKESSISLADVPGSTHNTSSSCDHTVPNDYGSIQDAIDNASSDDVVCVDAGTFPEQLTIDKALTLRGSGYSSSGTVLEGTDSGTGLEVASSNVTVEKIRIEGFNDGIELSSAMSNLLFKDVYSVENTTRGMTIGGGADLTGITMDGVSFSHNEGDGIRASTASKVEDLTIRDSHFDSNSGSPASSGIEVYQNSSNPGYFTNVLIKHTTFNNNGEKGMYLEKLNNATFDNITVNSSGTNSNYGFNNGIDINLKYGDYENITIKNSTITNSGLDSPDAPNPLFPAAIAIKARDDGSTYGTNPATLIGVNIVHTTITDNVSGIRLGEPGKENATPTNVEITNSNIYDNVRYGVINETLSKVSATCDYWGHATGAMHEDNPKKKPKGDMVTDGVNFIPWSVRQIGQGQNPSNACVGGNNK